MRKNKLESISKENFIVLINLKLLDLGENQVILLYEDFFEKINSLESLYLGLIHIKNLNSSLKNLTNIQNLDLSFNLFNFINIYSLNFENLIYLYLSNNVLNETKNFDFSNFKNLKILNLSRIHSYDLDVSLKFPFNSTLKELNLNSNNLTAISKSFSANLTYLQKTYLKDTYLINFDFLFNLVSLNSIYLSDNLEFFKNLAFPSSSLSYKGVSK